MDSLIWIIAGGLAMSAIAMIGGVTLVLKRATLARLLAPLVALAAGTLLGGAFFHMIPQATEALPPLFAAAWVVSGFTVFFALEEFTQWRHSHGAATESRKPFTYLVLIGDAVHNFVGGLGVASTFLVSPSAGITAWVAAAAHEVPQELGDFAVLVHGGWPRRRALLWNLVSALTFPLGGLVAYMVALQFEVAGLMLFGAGNFIYIAAADLIPEIKAQASLRATALHFGSFVVGLGSMFALAFWFHH